MEFTIVMRVRVEADTRVDAEELAARLVEDDALPHLAATIATGPAWPDPVAWTAKVE